MEEESKIAQLYYQLGEEKQSSPKYKVKQEKYIRQKGKFEKLLNKHQKKEFQKVIDLINDMNSQEIEEFFIEGFKLATKIMTEVFTQE